MSTFLCATGEKSWATRPSCRAMEEGRSGKGRQGGMQGVLQVEVGLSAGLLTLTRTPEGAARPSVSKLTQALC